MKAVEAISRLYGAQLLTYLKLSGLEVGFLMNFNVPLFKDGFAASSASFVVFVSFVVLVFQPSGVVSEDHAC